MGSKSLCRLWETDWVGALLTGGVEHLSFGLPTKAVLSSFIVIRFIPVSWVKSNNKSK